MSEYLEKNNILIEYIIQKIGLKNQKVIKALKEIDRIEIKQPSFCKFHFR